jgi:hypothetical protein
MGSFKRKFNNKKIAVAIMGKMKMYLFDSIISGYPRVLKWYGIFSGEVE